MKIVADDKIPFLKGVLEPFAQVVYLPADQINNPTLLNADVLLTRSVTNCNQNLLEHTGVKLIASATIGDDHIDKTYCRKSGIQWTTAKGCNAAAVDQYVLVTLIAIAKQQRISLAGKTIGIIGVGNIGSRVKKTVEVLGMNAMLYDPPREKAEGSDDFSSISDIHANSDFLSLHVPLTYEGEDKTSHLVDLKFLNHFEKNIILINTSRGAVVDQKALKYSIRSGKVVISALDVWENEPDIDLELLEMTAVATPHIAGYSVEGKAKGTTMAVQSVSRFFNLGIDSWTSRLTSLNETISMDCDNFTSEEIFDRVFRDVYDISEDVRKLKKYPTSFEDMRKNYQLRYENNNYILDLTKCSKKISDQLEKLGFRFGKHRLNN